MAAVTHRALTNCQSTAFRPRGWIEAMDELFRLWRSRMRERRTFVSFDERELRDLGMSRWQVERELAKPFWRG